MRIPWEVMAHYNFTWSLNKAYNAAATAEPGQCILIVGPTGVGKSTILDTVLDMLVGCPDTWPENELRYLRLECDREAPGAITRNIAVDLNRALGNPFVALQVPQANAQGRFGPVRCSLNEHDLRETFRVLAAQRKTRYVGLDAMENIAPKQRIAAEARFDSIKSLVRPHRKHAPAHEMTLILAGHHSLLEFWDVNAQLARRVTEIPVLPYRENAADIARFEHVLEGLSHYYPLKGDRSLRDWNDVLFRLSVGCFGLLRKLLDDAMVVMKCRKGQFLQLKDVIEAAPKKSKLKALKEDLDGIWEKVGTSATPEIVGDALRRERETEGKISSGRAKKRRRSKPGRRKVGPRDDVEVEYEAAH